MINTNIRPPLSVTVKEQALLSRELALHEITNDDITAKLVKNYTYYCQRVQDLTVKIILLAARSPRVTANLSKAPGIGGIGSEHRMEDGVIELVDLQAEHTRIKAILASIDAGLEILEARGKQGDEEAMRSVIVLRARWIRQADTGQPKGHWRRYCERRLGLKKTAVMNLCDRALSNLSAVIFEISEFKNVEKSA